MSDSIMQQCLGLQWQQLPATFQRHYAHNRPSAQGSVAGLLQESGYLDVEFPRFMLPLWRIMRVFGILLDRRGKACPTTVSRHYKDGIEYWQRVIRFADGREIGFDSHVEYAGGNEQIEFVNHYLGLRMAVHVADGELHYSGKSYVVRLGSLQVNIPNWLALGDSSIVETVVDDEHFAMDYRLVHPLLGRLFRYSGTFAVTP